MPTSLLEVHCRSAMRKVDQSSLDFTYSGPLLVSSSLSQSRCPHEPRWPRASISFQNGSDSGCLFHVEYLTIRLEIHLAYGQILDAVCANRNVSSYMSMDSPSQSKSNEL